MLSSTADGAIQPQPSEVECTISADGVEVYQHWQHLYWQLFFGQDVTVRKREAGDFCRCFYKGT